MARFNPPRPILAALVALAGLLAACGGNKTSPQTAVPTDVPVPTPTSIIPALAPPVRFTLSAVDPPPDPLPPVIYDLQAGLLAQASPAYAAARRTFVGWRIEHLTVDLKRNQSPSSMRIGVYNPATDAWQAFEVAGPPAFDMGHNPDGVISDDGSRAAAQLPDGSLLLIDLRAHTYVRLPLKLWPREFSPDGSHLIGGLEDDPEDGGGLSVLLEFANPLRAFRLPLGQADGPYEQWTPTWLDGSTLLTRTQNRTVLQLIDINPAPHIVLEEPVPSDQFVLSADRSMVGVQERIDRGTGRPGMTAYEYNVKVYSLRPFRLVATLPGAAMGYQLEQPSQPPDDARFLGIVDLCVEGKSRLVLFNIRDGSQTELARGKIMQYVFSPDGRWIAYTTWPGHGFVVPADASSLPRLVSEQIGPATPPAWSADSRYVSFNSYFGGGDYCI